MYREYVIKLFFSRTLMMLQFVRLLCTYPHIMQIIHCLNNDPQTNAEAKWGFNANTEIYREKHLKLLLSRTAMQAQLSMIIQIVTPEILGPKRVSNIEVKDNKINQLMHLIMLKNVGTIFNTVFLHCQILRHKRISCEFSIFQYIFR